MGLEIANGNNNSLKQAKEVLPEALFDSEVYDYYDDLNIFSGYSYVDTGKKWIDTQQFKDTDKSGVFVSEDGSIHYYKDGEEDTTYTGMAADADGNRYWFDNGTAARDKHVYSPEDDAWYWFDANGTMATGKDVFVARSNDVRSEGKWVRYDENGHMVKGEDYANGGWYRFDETTGEMAKGFYTVQDGDDTKLY